MLSSVFLIKLLISMLLNIMFCFATWGVFSSRFLIQKIFLLILVFNLIAYSLLVNGLEFLDTYTDYYLYKDYMNAFKEGLYRILLNCNFIMPIAECQPLVKVDKITSTGSWVPALLGLNLLTFGGISYYYLHKKHATFLQERSIAEWKVQRAEQLRIEAESSLVHIREITNSSSLSPKYQASGRFLSAPPEPMQFVDVQILDNLLHTNIPAHGTINADLFILDVQQMPWWGPGQLVLDGL